VMELMITGGTFRGRKVKVVPNEVTRYTPEKVRLALFSILGQYCDIESCGFCDLCAGSGIVGFEALSREALYTDFFDLSRSSVRTILGNANELRVKDRSRVYCRNLLTSIGRLNLEAEVIFIDPPFNREIAEKFFRAFSDSPNLMMKNALLMIEYNQTVPEITGFKKIDTYRYGTVYLNLFLKE